MYAEPIQTRQGNVLIVDDHPDNLHVLSELLNRHGHTTRCVRDGLSAVETALAHAPDLVLLDIRLPDMNGYEVCRYFKDEPALQHIPIIFVSALDQPVDRVRAFEVGGEDYINKPFDEREVLTRVKSKLLSYQLEQQRRELILGSERQRIARELHDSLQQTLFILGASAQSLMQQPDISDANVNQLKQIHKLSQTAIAELRVMLFELHPEKLTSVDLNALLKQLVESNRNRTEADLKLITFVEPLRLMPDVHVAFYRIAQEALHNAIMHAEAETITIILGNSGHTIFLKILDDGVGFGMSSIEQHGYGLANMLERAADLRLNISIHSQPDHGTEVKLIWDTQQTIAP